MSGGAARPRVVLVAHKVHEAGGMERALVQLVRHAHEHVDFEVVAVQVQEDVRDLVRWHRIRLPVRPVPALLAGFWPAAGAVARRCRGDLVHTMGALAAVPGDLTSVQFCHAAYREAQPELVTGREEPRLARRVNTAVAMRQALAMERWSYREGRVRLLAPASEGVARELRAHYPGIPTTVIPNAADLHRFRPDPAARAAARTEYGAAEDDMVAAFIGGDWRRKGLEVALRGVAAAGDDLRLWVAGHGDAAAYGRIADGLGLAGRVTFTGPTPRPERLLAGADVFVFPTAYEAFPLAALEAAACGLPVVATRVNGIEELVRDGEEGLLVNRDGPAVGAALARLAADTKLRVRMGTAARASASRFTWQAAGDATLSAYERLLAARTTRPAAPPHAPT